MKMRWFVSLTVGALLALNTARAEMIVYSEGGLSYTALEGDQVYFSIGQRCWGPQWSYFEFAGKAAAEAGKRTLAATQTIPITGKTIALAHEAQADGKNSVALRYTLSAPEASDLTGICVSLHPPPGLFGGTKCIAYLAGGKTNVVTLPFGRGLLGQEVERLVFHDKAGRETQIAIRPPRGVSSDGEGRISLVGNRIEANTPLETQLTLTMPEPVRFVAEEQDTLSRDDTSTWFPYPTGPDGVPVDLSFLNKDKDGNFVPAGAHGFVQVKGDDFVFADGTPARFWGVDCTAGAVLTSDARAAQIAERLARLGVNIVRLHHLDSWANPIVDYKNPDGTTQHMNPVSLRLLDGFTAEMKKRGIYCVLDPWVQRCFTAADGVADYGNLGKQGNFGLHPYIYFDHRMQELIQKQWQNVWTHTNAVTGLAYKDDPAMAMTEVINEGLLSGLNGVTQPFYRDELKHIYDAWAADDKGLPWDKAKVIEQNYGENNIRFMMYLQEHFYQQSHAFMRSIGIRVPINYNNWAHWTWIMVAQSGGDYMDHHHYYGGDQVGPGSGVGGLWLNHPPNVPGTPFGKIAGFALPGKPVASSECGNNPPKTYRAAYMLGLAAVADFQGWDSFTGFAFTQGGRPADRLGAFEWEADPVTEASLAAGALVFRRGDVSRAKETVVMRIPEKEIFELRYQNGGEKQYWNTAGFNCAIEEHKVLVVPPGFTTNGIAAVRVLDVDGSFAFQPPSTELRSDTGELWRDWKIGVGTIDTPRTQAAYGRLGESGKTWKTRDCEFSISTPFAVASLSSLTEAPIATSGRLLLTVGARAENSGMAFNLARTRIAVEGKAPVIAEPVVGSLTFKTQASKLAAYPLEVTGKRGAAIPIEIKDGKATLKLSADQKTLFYEIETASP